MENASALICAWMFKKSVFWMLLHRIVFITAPARLHLRKFWT